MLRNATLEEAVGRVVIGLKDRNILAHALRESPFLNFRDNENPQGVLPDPDDLIKVNSFSSSEHALTLLPEEYKRNGNDSNPAYYFREGRRVRFFSDVLGDELSDKIVYIVATPSTTWSPEQIVFRMKIALQTAKDMGAKRAYAVFSEFPFARQDRGVRRFPREDAQGDTYADRLKHAGQTDYVMPIMRDFLVNGCDGIVTLHHHSGHVAKAAEAVCSELRKEHFLPFVYDIRPSSLIARYLTSTDVFDESHKENYGEGIVFISPDEGALDFVREVKRLTGYKNAELARIMKKRGQPNAPDALHAWLIPEDGSTGNYDGKTGVILDDMVDTFGTMNSTISALSTGIERYVLYSTHGIYAQGAEDRLRKQGRVSDVLVMDTRPSRLRDLGPGTKSKVTIIKPVDYIAYALTCIERGENPNTALATLYQRDPSTFDQLYRIKRFDQHYTRSRR